MASQPWRDGIWLERDGASSHVIVVSGSTYQLKRFLHFDYPHARAALKKTGTLTAGDFGETPEIIRELTGGVERYNMQLKNEWFEKRAVLNAEGTRIMYIGWIPGKAEIMELASDEKIEEVKNSRDPVDAPSIPSYYTPQPHRKGRLLWFSGPPGAGKSTSAQLMGRHHGYIYYEGDAYFGFVNPYVDVHVDNPSLAQMSQKPLKGIPPHAIKKMDDASEVFKNMSKGIFEGLDETFQDMLPLLTEHVKQQRKQLGGDWSLAHAVFSRTQRERRWNCWMEMWCSLF